MQSAEEEEAAAQSAVLELTVQVPNASAAVSSGVVGECVHPSGQLLAVCGCFWIIFWENSYA